MSKMLIAMVNSLYGGGHTPLKVANSGELFRKGDSRDKYYLN
jgi:hypothetical protein